MEVRMNEHYGLTMNEAEALTIEQLHVAARLFPPHSDKLGPATPEKVLALAAILAANFSSLNPRKTVP